MSRCLTVGSVERQSYRLSLDHIAKGEWRAYFMGNNPMPGDAGVR